MEKILDSKKPRTASFLARGPGRFGIFSTLKPKKVTINDEICEFTYDLLMKEESKDDIVLNDGLGNGIKLGALY